MAAYALSAFCFKVSAYVIYSAIVASLLGLMGAILMSLTPIALPDPCRCPGAISERIAAERNCLSFITITRLLPVCHSLYALDALDVIQDLLGICRYTGFSSAPELLNRLTESTL